MYRTIEDQGAVNLLDWIGFSGFPSRGPQLLSIATPWFVTSLVFSLFPSLRTRPGVLYSRAFSVQSWQLFSAKGIKGWQSEWFASNCCESRAWTSFWIFTSFDLRLYDFRYWSEVNWAQHVPFRVEVDPTTTFMFDKRCVEFQTFSGPMIMRTVTF